MSDLISRQAVDDVIYDYSRSCDVNYAQIMEYIDKIPSVENKGEWINGDETRWKCSVCHYGVLDWNNTPFCPNCGADMRRSK